MSELEIIYQKDYPDFINPYLKSESMQRLKGVDMNCGLQFTSHAGFSSYGSYSRYEHSVGVACIVWHFTHDKKQTLAGLFHDISTRAFSHVIDFVKRDYLTQESTEDETKEIILQDKVIMNQLLVDRISVDEVSDYHIYPIADNDSPKLSSDRYGMEKLATLLRKAFQEHILTEADLYLSEIDVIQKLNNSVLQDDWKEYTRLKDVIKDSAGDIMVDAKKRYIDPCVNKCGRVTNFSAAFKNAVNEFRNTDYHYLMKGIYQNG